MFRLLLGIFRDLYVVLLIILILEQIPGSDLLHDLTRKGVITVTVFIVVAKLAQPLVEGTTSGPSRIPRRQKKTGGGKISMMEWASSEMQGWRPAMEDATCIVASLPAPLSTQAFFAVFDGHGGARVSLIASNEFPKVLAACAANLNKAEDGLAEANADGDEAASEGTACSEPVNTARSEPGSVPDLAEVPPKLAGEALHSAMLTMDALLRRGGDGAAARNAEATGQLSRIAKQLESNDERNAFSTMGSTAIVVLVDCGGNNNGTPRDSAAAAWPRRVVVANCGDSRAVLCRGGKAVELSEDHKPENPGEEARIRRAGGHVAMIGPCYRVDGVGLNLSRALGDFHYKARNDLPVEQQKVIAVPDIRTLDLCEADEFLLLGCDGIFELHSSQKAVDIVRCSLQSGLSVEKAAEELVDQSCSPNLMQTCGKGGDNCSAIVVRFTAATY